MSLRTRAEQEEGVTEDGSLFSPSHGCTTDKLTTGEGVAADGDCAVVPPSGGAGSEEEKVLCPMNVFLRGGLQGSSAAGEKGDVGKGTEAWGSNVVQGASASTIDVGERPLVSPMPFILRAERRNGTLNETIKYLTYYCRAILVETESTVD